MLMPEHFESSEPEPASTETPRSILHFPEGGGKDDTLSLKGYRRVIQQIQEEGVEPYVVRGEHNYDLESRIVLAQPIEVTQDGSEIRVSTGDPEPVLYTATSLRDYSRKHPVPSEATTQGAHVINNEKVRQLDEKLTAHRVFEEYQARTFLLEPERLSQQLVDIRSPQVVLKPTTGADSRGLLIVAKSELQDPERFHTAQENDTWFLRGNTDPPIELDLSTPYLLQEFINTSQPLPPGIELLDSVKPYYEAHIHERKEVRLMAYWDAMDPSKQTFIPFVRIFESKAGSPGTRSTQTERWLLADIQQQLPSDLNEMARSIATRTTQYGEARYMHGALDCAYDGERWFLIEANLWFPAPISYRDAREQGAESLADIHRAQLGTLLADSAKDAHNRSIS